MAEKVNLQKKIQEYRQTNLKLKNLSDEKVLSIMVQNRVITISEEQKRLVFANNKTQNSNMGLHVEKSAKKPNSAKTIYLQSGRKVVYTKTANGKLALKYYGTDGTQLNPDYFKKVEGQISISADGTSYTLTKNGKKSKPIKAKDPTQGAIDQNLARLNNEEKRLNKTKDEQGFIGSSWDWIKNKTGIGDGSDKAQKQIETERKLLNQIKTGKISKKDFKEVTGLDYSKENLEKFKRGELSQATAKIDGYKQGQEMASDVAGDMISGIAAVGIYTAAVAAAPFTGGASIAIGITAATASGALIKTGVKALDTVGTDRKYTLKDFGHDCATGAFSGALAPITGGLGGAVGKTVATKLGIQAVKQVGKEVAEEVVEQGVKQGVKQGLKTALTNPTGYEYVGGTLVKRGIAMTAEMATDGALGGAIDGGFRAGLDNDWDADAIIDGTIEGGVGGALMAPIIGGGFKAAGKGGQKLGEKIKGNKGANEVAEVAISKKIMTGKEAGVVSHANNKTNDINSNAKSKENPAILGKITLDTRKFNNPQMQKLVGKAPQGEIRTRLLDLDSNIDSLPEGQIKTYVDKKLNEVKNLNDLLDLETLVDAYNEFVGNYSHLRDIYRTRDGKLIIVKSDASKIDSFLKDKSGKTQLVNVLNHDADQALPGKLRLDIFISDKIESPRLYSTKKYIKTHPNSEMSEYLFNEYVSNRFSKHPELKQKLLDINEKYGVKLFVPSKYHGSKMNESLNFITQELDSWKVASNGTAKLPPIIDFNTAKVDWYDTGSAYGQGTSNAYSETMTGSLAFHNMDIRTIAQSMRHELTHSNDLTRTGLKIPEKYNLDEIMPKKTIIKNGKEVKVPDFEHCMYADEFRAAGLPENRIPYAYNNPKEFIARASEGDMSKYSPEFRQILIDFGMPEWIFKMQ